MSAQPDPQAGLGIGTDADQQETREWMDALSAVIEKEGPERAHSLLEQLLEHARQSSIDLPFSANTGYVNTIEPEQEAHCPGNIAIEKRLRAYMRWNAMAMVVRANRLNPADGGDLGGHIGSFASVASMFGAGFNHFWHAASENHGGDLLYIQGHSAPGIYARAYLEGRLSEEQLDSFRQEVDGKGLSSYPHPKLMPEFWQFPTVSMGLGPLMAIYQARFLKYLHARGIANTENRKVWAFMGDGEMDEPESLGAISLAGRESLDNLIFVINCNLQRLDGPVRGNGKIVQELESVFRGAGWNVIKVLWGSGWDKLLAADKSGKLLQRMEECVDGEYQDFKSRACVIAPAPIQTTVSAVLAPACRGDGTVASAVEARMRVMKAAAVPLPFAVDSRKARRKALMRPASTARMSQRRLKPAAASTALSASPFAPFSQQRAIR